MKQQPGEKDSSKKPDVHEFEEETAAEITPDIGWEDIRDIGFSVSDLAGYAALFIGVLSFFFMPGLMGLIAVVLSAVALGQGKYMVGGWAMAVALHSLGWWFLFVPFM